MGETLRFFRYLEGVASLTGALFGVITLDDSELTLGTAVCSGSLSLLLPPPIPCRLKRRKEMSHDSKAMCSLFL